MRFALFLSATALTLFLSPVPAHAASNAEVESLRQSIEELKQDYESRIRALEQRLEAAEQSQAPARQQAETAPPAQATSAPRSEAGSGNNAFNPAFSLILQGTYADYSVQDHAEIPGFLLGGETEFRPEGLSLRETELNAEANVDSWLRAWTTIGFEEEDGETHVHLEEAYGETLSLPGGLGLKFGRFFSDIGYQNRQHNHGWDFVDAPLPYRAMLANQLGADGLQLRWLAPTDLFIELGGEISRGNFPAGGEDQDDINLYTLFARTGGDIGTNASWRIGLSHVGADADGRESGEHDSDEVFLFDGRSDLYIADLVIKWAPDGNPARQHLIYQSEFFYRTEDGSVTFDDGAGTTVNSNYDGEQNGFYSQLIWQFMPRWRTGLRYDRLWTDNDLDNAGGGEFDVLANVNEDNPQRWSWMADYSPSEFSRFRLQYNRDESRPMEEADDQLLLQYILSIGSHPAHEY